MNTNSFSLLYCLFRGKFKFWVFFRRLAGEPSLRILGFGVTFVCTSYAYTGIELHHQIRLADCSRMTHIRWHWAENSH